MRHSRKRRRGRRCKRTSPTRPSLFCNRIASTSTHPILCGLDHPFPTKEQYVSSALTETTPSGAPFTISHSFCTKPVALAFPFFPLGGEGLGELERLDTAMVHRFCGAESVLCFHQLSSASSLPLVARAAFSPAKIFGYESTTESVLILRSSPALSSLKFTGL